MKLRDARSEDAALLEGIRVRAWHEAYPGLVEQEVLDALDPTDEQTLAVWRNLIDGPEGFAFVQVAVNEGGTPIGFVAVAAPSRDEDEDDSVAEIAAIYVDPEHYRGGVGRAMMEHVLERLKDDGYEECTVWTLDKNVRALALYEGLGFRRDGSERTDDQWLVPDVRLRRAL